MSPPCGVCHDLWQCFSNPVAERKIINLGSFEDALTSQCSDHTRIIEHFKNQWDSTGVSKDVGFLPGGPGRSTTLTESVTKLGRCWELLAVKRTEVNDHPGVGRILDPDWMDLEVVNRWKRDCLSSHGLQCQNPLKLPSTSPGWLIDIQRKCLVPGGNGKPYVALSYRSADDMLPTSTLEDLQQDGALDSTEILAELPLKIKHAISLTAALGEKYLWADFLCFDTSDATTTFEQLSLMSSIYAGALFTIIAADGERKDGIKGLRGISEPRVLNQKVFPLGLEKLIKRNTGVFTLENWHEYHQRGWTYQEFKMSPRKLLFMRGEVHWQCNCSVWHEELTLSSEVDTYIDPRPQVICCGFPDLESLSHMLSTYNRRQLTYDEDALAAITGLLTVFSRSFEGGFLYGLPEMLFDRALAWQPQWPHTDLRRRETPGKHSRIQFTDTNLPTWSWVAWQGMFTDRYGEACRHNPRASWIEETIPITEWYTSSTPTGQARRRIRSTWFEKREHRKDVDQPLPNGWTRLPASDDDLILFPDGCGEYLYHHNAMPDKDCDTWFYPFNVPDINELTPCTVPEQTRYLFCKTWKVSVWSCRTIDDMFKSNHLLTLRNGVQEPDIGKLHLQTDAQLDMWPVPRDGEIVPNGEDSGKTIELIAINRCVHYAKTFDHELQRYGHPLKREERMTVLWVEWDHGVAYRLACGWVEKEAWDSLPSEAVDLVLG